MNKHISKCVDTNRKKIHKITDKSTLIADSSTVFTTYYYDNKKKIRVESAARSVEIQY